MAKWDEEKKMIALATAEMSTIREASEQTGVPEGTIKRWRSEMRAAGRKVRIVRRLEPNAAEKAEPKIEPAAQPEVKTEPASVGRPSKYREEFSEQAFKLCLLGATDVALANFFEVDEATIYRWKDRYPDFCEAIKAGKFRADAEVANKLYQRALGYSHPEDKIFQYEGDPVIVPTMKHYPPDVKAAIMWLQNRQPELWRDKQEVVMSGRVDVSNPFEGLSTDELRQLVSKGEPVN